MFNMYYPSDEQGINFIAFSPDSPKRTEWKTVLEKKQVNSDSEEKTPSEPKQAKKKPVRLFDERTVRIKKRTLGRKALRQKRIDGIYGIMN